MAAPSISQSGSTAPSLALDDYSLYSHLNDDELLQLAIERSLKETHNNNAATTSTPPPHPVTRTCNQHSSHNPPVDYSSHNPPVGYSSHNPPVDYSSHNPPVDYSSPNPPAERPPDPEDEPLFQAIRTGDVNKVRRLVMHSGTKLMLPSKQGWLAIHQAAWYGQDTCLRVLLSAQPGMINKKADCGETALMVAVSQEHVPCVQVLLENGADPDISNREKETPLYKACERNNTAMVAALLNHGAVVNTRCLLGWTALQEAVCRNNVEVCEMLLRAGAKLSLTNIYGISPLFTAAQSGQLAALRFLLKHGADINSQAADGATALYEATKNEHQDIVELLISQKADANKPGKTGLLPLHVASQTGNEAIVSMLIAVTSKARVRRTGISPLHVAAEYNCDDVLELLIQAGFDVNAQLSQERSKLYEDRRSTPLYFSVINGNIEAVEMLLAAGANPNMDMFRPLMVAARQCCVKTVTLLVEHGADVNACIPTHPTTFPAVYMFSMKYLPMFKYLLDHGGHALCCFECVYGSGPHPPINITRSESSDDVPHDRQQRTGVQFCEMISAPSICRWAGPIIDLLLDYVGHVTLCSRLIEHLNSYNAWSVIKDKAAPPRPLLHLCRLRIEKLVGHKHLKKLPLPGALIRFLKHQHTTSQDES
ncbi:ankyrin repeat and SOCS box protein 2-like isoform X2 [Takifugu rubripes]|uniref:Ankyrin repeat and SOCS box containing 2a, tandem duplicate 1 n=1 Tax=Takifugu rubripes TaxID=31033 RepID=H2UW62_TAKRU|nr:ankyrin repeat and SOCS box protein 2-like isoform X2 [Takifugu rubripes]